MIETRDFHALRAMLEWQMAMGVDEAITDAPVNRFDAIKSEPAAATTAPVADTPIETDAVEAAKQAAGSAQDLPALQTALEAYDRCDLKRGARNTVFADGRPGARVMIIGEAPGRDEDRQGLPFVGRAGQLLDRMLDAINMARQAEDIDRAIYITNILPWRPPQNRDPSAEEIAMLRPFVERHVELAAPDVLVLMGNVSCSALMGMRGITRLRGKWTEVLGKPALPMFHPAYLLRNPVSKREAWHDLLMLQARLRDG